MTKPRTGKNINCEICKKEFYIPQCRFHNAKYCSYECSKHKKFEGLRHLYNCVTCGKECESPPSRRNTRKKYCSRDCRDVCTKDREQQRLEYNANRKLNGNWRTSSVTLKKYVLSIKLPICEVCGFKEHICCIEIHHIDEDRDNNDLSNIKVVCCNCHRRHHRGDLKPKS
jgi:hypothetical protein